jgi:Ca2+-binding RTX toxin-like protein
MRINTMSQTFTAQYFRQSGPLAGFDVNVISTGVASVTLTDTNLIRADGAGETVRTPTGFSLFDGYTGLNGVQSIFGTPQTSEAVVTVNFNDGTSLFGVQALFDVQTGPYTLTDQWFLLDTAALSSVGKSLTDVSNVRFVSTVDHSLDWDDFGFAPAGGTGGGDGTPDPMLNLVQGTAGNDRLTGTTGDDLIRGGGDDDRLTGRAGADSFVFGADARDADRDRDVITDFAAGVDQIVFEAGAQIRHIEERNGNVIIQLEGDRDTIVVQNADLGIQSDFVSTDNIFVA